MTHAIPPTLRSWVDVPPDSDFPLQNLPFGIFHRPGEEARAGTAIGESVVDLAALHAAGAFSDTAVAGENVFDRDALNDFMAMGRGAWRSVRARLVKLLREDGHGLRDDAALRNRALVPMGEVEMILPARIGDYVDFYSSLEHATNLGKMFRDPENPLLPNWRHIPIGYNGRSSSVLVSGTPIRRPSGQAKADDAPAPSFGPSRLLDIELELGFFTGPGNALGATIPVERAEEHIFGFVLINDWSARDIQKWEYVPLGPFLGKSFGTTISPWVVTLDALEPFRVPAPVQEPEPLPYLRLSGNRGIDVHLEVGIATPSLTTPATISRTNSRNLYWTPAQQLAHQASNGTNVRPGDLYASGTISGPTADSYGSLLELSWRGTKPIVLPNGETRTFLRDGDTVVLRGWCEGPGVRIGFGECRGTILPAG